MTQALLEILPGSDVNPAGQSEHAEEPSVEYLPAGQMPEQEDDVKPTVAP